MNNGLDLPSNTLSPDLFFVAIALTNSEIVYGETANGFYKTTDGGVSWSAMNNGLATNASVNSLAIDPTNSQIVYVGTNGGVFKTTDGGATWTAMNDGLMNLHVASLSIAPTNSGVILHAGTEGNGVYKIRDKIRGSHQVFGWLGGE